MIENAKLFDRLLLENKLRPIDPNDPVPLYDVDEIRIAWLAYSRMSRGLVQHLNIPTCRGKFGICSLMFAGQRGRHLRAIRQS
jgi:hypothetical protein